MKPANFLHFPGWRPFEEGEVFQEGDKLIVNVQGTKESRKDPYHNNKDSFYLGKVISDEWADGFSLPKIYWAWRKTDGRRLPGNPHFAKELPLP